MQQMCSLVVGNASPENRLIFHAFVTFSLQISCVAKYIIMSINKFIKRPTYIISTLSKIDQRIVIRILSKIINFIYEDNKF